MKTTAFIFSLFLLFKPIIPLVEYAAFYDYIKDTLCINKEVPESDCNGKCYLMKQLAKSADSEKGSENNYSFIAEHSIVFYQDIITNYLDALPKEQNSKQKTSYNKIYKFDYMPFIFHPPIV